MKHTMGILAVVFMTGICAVSFGDALLLDMYGNGNPTSSSDWSDAGIAEDVTGAAGAAVSSGGGVYNLSGGLSYTLTGGSGGAGSSIFTSAVLNDYHYVYQGTETVSLGGFSNGSGSANTLTTGTYAGLDGNTFTLQANQQYKLYIFGAGNADNQNASITFDGVTKTTATAIVGTDEAAGHMVSYDFTTGADLTGFTVDFTVSNDASDYGMVNGVAIVAVPEPATLGLLVLVGVSGLFIRRLMI